MSSGHGVPKPNTAGHPGRQVHRDRFLGSLPTSLDWDEGSDEAIGHVKGFSNSLPSVPDWRVAHGLKEEE